MKLYFDVKNQIITRTDRNQVIANSSDYLEAEVTFSEEWTGLEKTMTFKNGDVLYTIVLNNDKILQENHLNLGVGTWKVSIQGVAGDQKIVTNESNLAVNASGWVGSEAIPPESVWNQLLVIIESLHTEVASTAALRSAVQKYIEDNYDALVKEEVIVDDVRAALDDMAEDGTLSDLLAPLVAAGMPSVVADQISAVVAAQIGATVASQIGAVVASQITAPVNQAVKDYCDDNFSGWSGALDRGLTQPLMAAPADLVGAIKSALSETTGFAELTNWSANHEYIKTDIDSGITVNTPTSTTSDVRYLTTSCSEGDVFYVTCAGGNASRAWCFVDDSGNSLLKSNAAVTANKLKIVAPANSAYLVVNDTTLVGKVYSGKRVTEQIYTINHVISGDMRSYNVTVGSLQKCNYDFVKGGHYTITNKTGGYISISLFNADGTSLVVKRGVANNEPVDFVVDGDGYWQFGGTPNSSGTLEIVTHGILDIMQINERSTLKILNLGDSIFGLDGEISVDLANITGATVYNGAVGGTRALARPTISYRYFDGTLLVKALCDGDWTEQDAAAEALAPTDPKIPIRLATLKSLNLNEIDIVTMNWGTNDYTADNTSAQVIAAYQSMIDMLQTYYPSLKIVILTPIWRYFGTIGESDYEDGDTKVFGGGVTLKQLSLDIEQMAKDRRIFVKNMYQVMPLSQYTATNYFDVGDKTHLNAKGNLVYAHILNGVLGDIY